MTPETLAPLAFAVPLAVAALCAAIGPFVPRRVLDALAIATGLFCTVACALLAQAATRGTIVHWFGGWTPRHGIALGIAFTVDPAGGALAAFAAFLSTAALLFAWTYYDESGPPFPVLMLTFMSALIGFFLTGDLFNMFVFFELMGVAAYALTAYRTEDESAVLGAFAFGVLNSVGAFLVLLGIALVYGRTGALNMAQISHALGTHADALIVLAFAFVAAGLLVKAALAPFHFWLADAHAVAPTPLCVLFSGIMVQAGLYAVARVYWSVFSGALGGHEQTLRTVLIVFGLVTAFTGAFMCFGQRHFKRLLAFSTIAHTGILVCAFALLSAHGVAGMIVYVLGHGLTKGGLFMCSGILLNRLGTVDVEQLRGKLSGEWVGIVAIALGALALAGMPPFGTFLGSSLIEHAAEDVGLGWLPWVLLIAAALTGGSVLNALGRMAFGWGPPPDPEAKTPQFESPEANQGDKGFPLMMYACAAFLIVCACAIGLIPRAASAALGAGERFVDRAGQLAIVLKETPGAPLALPPAEPITSSLASGLLAAVLAVAFAALALFAHRLPSGADATKVLETMLKPLRRIHDGVVTDYVAWLAAGTAALGTALAAWMR
ncbi:MAG TPA: proton-conducting transporter membrane subunit [Candidatus Elarobacter sp.]|jgi:multicomponent Na+:H+ antiporter subunit D|nr:proton-conducting transporter membrane subunit [Candidatus Elarobacter sp.]